jgi:hypothetical protein
MVKKYLLCSIFLLFACGIHEPSELSSSSVADTPSSSSEALATIKFINKTSYPIIDIYRNYLLETPDSLAFICSVYSGQSKTVSIKKSKDSIIGDNFFVRYKFPLANRYESGIGQDINIDAEEKEPTNMIFVVKVGESYTKEIPQPNPNDLKVSNGYIKIRNIGNTDFRVVKGNEQLKGLGDKRVISSGEWAFFEFGIPFFSNTSKISQLKIDRTIGIANVDDFDIERGKLYSFDVDNTTISEPDITDINPFIQ